MICTNTQTLRTYLLIISLAHSAHLFECFGLEIDYHPPTQQTIAVCVTENEKDSFGVVCGLIFFFF